MSDAVTQQHGAEHRHVRTGEQHFYCVAPAMNAAATSKVCANSAVEDAHPT